MYRTDVEPRPREGTRASGHERWIWFLPPVVAFLVLFAAPFGLLDQLLGMVLALPMVVAAVRRPGGALLVLGIFLPLQKYLLAVPYRLGVPLAAVRGLGWTKEAMVLGIVIAGVHSARTAGRRLDVVDRIALLWVAGVGIYMLFPQILSGPNAPTSINIRLQGFRANTLFVLLFLGARHAPLGPGIVRAFRRVIIGVGTLVAFLGIYQFIDPHGWINFTYDIVRVPTYQANVLGHSPQQVFDQFAWLFENPQRVGSVLISPFEFVDFVLIGIAFALAQLVRGGRQLPIGLALAIMSVALVTSKTRSTLLAAALVGIVLLRPGAGRVARARVRIAALAVVAVVLVAPFQVGTRITGAEGGTVSANAHVGEFTTGLRQLIDEPIGQGLGTAPGVGTRFEIEGTFVSDNAYLQVGNELGVVMMLVFIALLVILLQALRSVPPNDEATWLAQALWAAGLGLCMAGMVHHVWLSLPVAWLFFGGAGIALSVHPRPDRVFDSTADR